MWQVFAGTVLLASVLAVAGLWALLWAVRHLEDDDDAGETDLLVEERAPRLVASDRERRDVCELHALQSEERRRELRRRVEAAAKVRGPARIDSRRVPPDAA